MAEMAKLRMLKAFANSSILATLLCKISMIKVELAGIDSNGGPCYVGTGCFHRRETLCGKMYDKECKGEQTTRNNDRKIEEIKCKCTRRNMQSSCKLQL